MLRYFHHLVSLVDRYAQSQAVGLKSGKEVLDGIQELTPECRVAPHSIVMLGIPEIRLYPATAAQPSIVERSISRLWISHTGISTGITSVVLTAGMTTAGVAAGTSAGFSGARGLLPGTGGVAEIGV